jgi:hypothetical protein
MLPHWRSCCGPGTRPRIAGVRWPAGTFEPVGNLVVARGDALAKGRIFATEFPSLVKTDDNGLCVRGHIG